MDLHSRPSLASLPAPFIKGRAESEGGTDNELRRSRGLGGTALLQARSTVYKDSDMSRDLEPKLFTVLREGYPRAQLLKDLLAGLVVGIVAFPLALAFAIASASGGFKRVRGGVTPRAPDPSSASFWAPREHPLD